MRKDFIITLLALSCFAAYGQNYDPYAVFGHKSDVIYETQKDFFKIFVYICTNTYSTIYNGKVKFIIINLSCTKKSKLTLAMSKNI